MHTGAESAPQVFGRLFNRLQADRMFFLQAAEGFKRNPQYFNASETVLPQFGISRTEGARPGEVAALIILAFTMMVEAQGKELPALRQSALGNLLGRFDHLSTGYAFKRECILLWEAHKGRLGKEHPGLLRCIRQAIRRQNLTPADNAIIHAVLGVFFALYFQAKDEISFAVEHFLC